MNILELVLACAIGVFTSSATFAQKSSDSIAQDLTAILQNPDETGACTSFSSFTINGRSVAYSNCIMECSGEQQVAKLDDLEISSAFLWDNPMQRESKLGTVVLRCRDGKFCVERSSGSSFGSKRGVGCINRNVTTTYDKVIFVLNKADGEAFLRLLRQMK